MDIKPKIIYLKPSTLETVADFKAFGKMLKAYVSEPMLIAGTALVGMKNILKGIVDAHQKSDLEEAMKKLDLLRAKHYELVELLLGKEHPIYDELNDHFVTIEWDLEEPKHVNIDYAYDQTIAVGQLLGTQIMAAYLQQIGIEIHWMDARDIILADDVFGNANVLKSETGERIQKHLEPLLKQGKIVLSQASLGGTTENYSITLGLENAVSRSVLAIQSCFDIDQLLIWDGNELNEMNND